MCGSCCASSQYCGSTGSDLTLSTSAGGLASGSTIPAFTPMTCFQEDRSAAGSVGAWPALWFACSLSQSLLALRKVSVCTLRQLAVNILPWPLLDNVLTVALLRADGGKCVPNLAGLTNTTAFCSQLIGAATLSTTVYQASVQPTAEECQTCSNGTASCSAGLTCYQAADSWTGLCVADDKPLAVVPLACPLAKLTTTKLVSESCSALSSGAQQILDSLKASESAASALGLAPSLSPAAAPLSL